MMAEMLFSSCFVASSSVNQWAILKSVAALLALLVNTYLQKERVLSQ